MYLKSNTSDIYKELQSKTTFNKVSGMNFEL